MITSATALSTALAVLSHVWPLVSPYIGTLLVAVIMILAGVAKRAISKMKDGKVKHASLVVADSVKEGFLFAETKVAPKLRGPDGKLPPDAKVVVKAAAVAAAWEYLTVHAFTDVKANLKKTDAELEADLGDGVESMAASRPSNESVVATNTESAKLTVTLPSGRLLVMPAP